MSNDDKDKKNTDPIQDKGDVKKSNDEHIDQDFPGFPGHPAKENIINPKTDEDRTVAGIGEDDEDD
ncbi:MAG TPA: hypothetical protein PKM63_19395 [Panacibacter sp.]|nr:hypothetical protein [Panacibacter sp.]HNP46469.1 hypothetical protein [Panacibacter sp.]